MPNSVTFNEHYKTVMGRYDDKYFDLAVCDIPYGINVGKMAFLKENKTTVKQKNGKRLNPNKGKKIHGFKSWDEEVPPQEYFNELCRISNAQIIFGIEYVNWSGVGTGRIKWDKGVPDGLSFKRYEIAFCSLIEGEVTLPLLWSGMSQAKSLSEPMTQQGNKRLNEKRIHPCHKPVMLYKKLYMDYGFEGMKIIDTHLGSGSSRIAAYEYNCEFVGCDIDAEYYMDEERRFAKHISQSKLKLY